MENIFLKILAIVMCIIGIIWIFEKILFLFRKDTNFYNNKNCIFFNILNFLKSFFPILVLIFIIRSFIFEPFYIPSESMIPTLLPGDCIIVKKFIYGFNNPFNNTQLISYSHPKRSDIIVFKNSKHSNIYYVKRIIGVPGDKIIYDSINKIITIYEQYNMFHDKKKILISYNDNSKKFKKDIIKMLKLNYKDNFLKNHFNVYQEKINHKQYNILISALDKNIIKLYFNQMHQPNQIWIVPKGKYFVMGDNRDNSLDSRYWGFVEEKNIIGKTNYIFMNFSTLKNYLPIEININRIGKIN